MLSSLQPPEQLREGKAELKMEKARLAFKHRQALRTDGKRMTQPSTTLLESGRSFLLALGLTLGTGKVNVASGLPLLVWSVVCLFFPPPSTNPYPCPIFFPFLSLVHPTPARLIPAGGGSHKAVHLQEAAESRVLHLWAAGVGPGELTARLSGKVTIYSFKVGELDSTDVFSSQNKLSSQRL